MKRPDMLIETLKVIALVTVLAAAAAAAGGVYASDHNTGWAVAAGAAGALGGVIVAVPYMVAGAVLGLLADITETLGRNTEC